MKMRYMMIHYRTTKMIRSLITLSKRRLMIITIMIKILIIVIMMMMTMMIVMLVMKVGNSAKEDSGASFSFNKRGNPRGLNLIS